MSLSHKIDVGMPVFNGERYIKHSIESLLSQTYSNFTLIISDNSSTDRTEEICLNYARLDKRVRYFRQSKNLGALSNFEFVLNAATAPYFMWAAADDYWYPEFLEKNLDVLEQNSSVVASISKVKMDRLVGRNPASIGTYPLTGTYSAKLRQFFKCLGANSRFYSLYRREAIQQSFIPLEFMGGMDGITLIRVIEFGDFYELDEILMERSCYGSSNRLLIQQFEDFGIRGFEKLFPLLKLSIWFWQNTSIKISIRCLDCLLRLNLFFSFIVVTELLGVRQLVRKLKADENPG